MSALKKLVVVLYCFSTLNGTAQHVIIPAYHNPYIINFQKHKGYIEFNNGKKVEGNFQYGFWEFPSYNLKSFSEEGKLINRYKSKDIKMIAFIGSDTALTTKDSTYFKTLDKSKALYRQLTFGSVEVYDYFFNVNERSGLIKMPIIVIAKGQLFEFNKGEKFINWMKTNYPDEIKWHENITVQEIIRQLNGME